MLGQEVDITQDPATRRKYSKLKAVIVVLLLVTLLGVAILFGMRAYLQYKNKNDPLNVDSEFNSTTDGGEVTGVTAMWGGNGTTEGEGPTRSPTTVALSEQTEGTTRPPTTPWRRVPSTLPSNTPSIRPSTTQSTPVIRRKCPVAIDPAQCHRGFVQRNWLVRNLCLLFLEPICQTYSIVSKWG